MAVIQFRSGAYADYDPAKMQAAEPAVVLSGDPDTEDGKSVRVAFGSGTDKRLLTEDDLPSPPSNNGTYHLTCTVSSGTVTYSWTS